MVNWNPFPPGSAWNNDDETPQSYSSSPSETFGNFSASQPATTYSNMPSYSYGNPSGVGMNSFNAAYPSELMDMSSPGFILEPDSASSSLTMGNLLSQESNTTAGSTFRPSQPMHQTSARARTQGRAQGARSSAVGSGTNRTASKVTKSRSGTRAGITTRAKTKDPNKQMTAEEIEEIHTLLPGSQAGFQYMHQGSAQIPVHTAETIPTIKAEYGYENQTSPYMTYQQPFQTQYPTQNQASFSQNENVGYNIPEITQTLVNHQNNRLRQVNHPMARPLTTSTNRK
jgi:hypothetical protein